MPTITNAVVLSASNATAALLMKDFPARVAFKIARMHQELSQARALIAHIDEQLIEKYAARDDKGEMVLGAPNPDGSTVYQIEPAHALTFQQERLDLLTKADARITDYLTVEELAHLTLSPALLDALGPLLVEIHADFGA